MVVLRIAVLSGCGLMLGGCLSAPNAVDAFAPATPLAVSDAALPPTSEPGRLLKSGLGENRGGLNPTAELTSSVRARVAWEPLRPDRLSQQPTFAAHSANFRGADTMADPAGTASLTPAAKSGLKRGSAPPARNGEEAFVRLEREGHRDAKSICSGC
ncbi:hypothetical protein ACRAWG_36730 [Methylobacterium sp. P31]